MPIKLIALTCPRCGGSLEMPVDSETFYCKYCGALIYADDGSTKLQIEANVRGTIDANVDANVRLRDEAEMRRVELEERMERRDRVEAYRKRWRRQLWLVPLASSFLAYLPFHSPEGEASDAAAFAIGVALVSSAIFLFLRRPGRYERSLVGGYAMGSGPNRDALLRKLDEGGREDYAEYRRRWLRQIVAYPVLLVLPFVVARLLVFAEGVAISSIENASSGPFVTARYVNAALFFVILFAGPPYLYRRRPSKYLENYVRTANGDVVSRD